MFYATTIRYYPSTTNLNSLFFFSMLENNFRRPNRSRASLQQPVQGVGGDTRPGVHAGSHLGQSRLVRDVDRRDRRPLARDDDGRIGDASRQRHIGYVWCYCCFCLLLCSWFFAVTVQIDIGYYHFCRRFSFYPMNPEPAPVRQITAWAGRRSFDNRF